MRVCAKADFVASTGIAADSPVLDNQTVYAGISGAPCGYVAKIAERSIAVLYYIDLILDLLLFLRVGLGGCGIILVFVVLPYISLSWITLICVVLIPAVLIPAVLIVNNEADWPHVHITGQFVTGGLAAGRRLRLQGRQSWV